MTLQWPSEPLSGITNYSFDREDVGVNPAHGNMSNILTA